MLSCELKVPRGCGDLAGEASVDESLAKEGDTGATSDWSKIGDCENHCDRGVVRYKMGFR